MRIMLCRTFTSFVLALVFQKGYSYRRLSQDLLTYVTMNASDWFLEEVEDHRQLSEVTAEKHLVSSLPGLKEELVHYAGHVNIDHAKGSNIFYWLFEAPQNSDTLPLLIWLNGGPGCSSMDGLWLELGPLRLDPNSASVLINRHSWHNVANLLFIDQPVGTGFAYTKSKNGLASNDDMVNTQFYTFLQEFFKLHPRYVNAASGSQHTSSRTRPLFISGESHAGHYIPTMAAHILQKNAAIGDSGSGDGLLISLEGIALGIVA
jgi:carboxypeptidase C (cathepsin A)